MASADQRNQNSAAGAITLLIAGFCSSGILGIDGVCTKLKYQSSPIHITPAITCSQRTMNRSPPRMPPSVNPPTASTMTINKTTPAVMVLPSDEKKAPMAPLL